MRARRDDRSDDFALFHRGVEIGSVRGGTVSFAGFTTRPDAALAASLAHHALKRRRARDAYRRDGSGAPTAVRVRGHEGAGGEIRWAFEIDLSGHEVQDVFATSRARTMWAALRAAGLDRRMYQLRGEPTAMA